MSHPSQIHKLFESGLISVYHQNDIINQYYRINFNAQLEDLSLHNAKAYSVISTKQDDKIYYALVCDQSSYIRLSEAISLLKNPISGILNPICISCLLLEKNERALCIIFERPTCKSLKNQIRQFISEDNIIKNVHHPIMLMINDLHKSGIQHGCINLDNIFFDSNNNKIILGQCVVDGFTKDQQEFFETAIRAEAIYKSFHDLKADYYAVAMLLFSLFYDHGDILKSRITENRLAQGTIPYLLKLSPLTGKLGSIIRKLVSEYQCFSENILSKPIILFNRKFFNKVSIAHALFEHWHEAKELLINGELMKFLNKYNLLTDIKDIKVTGSEKFDHYDFKLSAIILLLDESALIRIDGLAFYPSAVIRAINNDTMKELIKSNFFQYIKTIITNIHEKNSCIVLIKYQHFLKNKFGYGPSRLLYELSDLPTIISNDKAINGLCDITTILITMEKSNYDVSSIMNDQDMINFFIRYNGAPAAMMNINSIKLNEDRFIDIIEHLASAQDITSLKLNRLCESIGQELEKRLKNIIFNNKLLNEISSHIKKIRDNGIIRQYIDMLKQHNYFYNDYVEYKHALHDIQKMEIKIKKMRMLRSSLSTENLQNTAIKVSYCIIFFSILHLMIS